ncbi:hypothetical protein BMS3Bbin12_00134 [bacterium BMS3Bbin12]|nr:hypothetical protein BMS3Abin12_02049 [bacterium BMS3Abin12]GBE46981.1 hypothetical protein BMS3Bbin12_00134 [bacterium BMS3Bbin12]GBE49486.1 hypothetical protein BMS3Bbin13_00405 [bacterium BMS3Bbin13]
MLKELREYILANRLRRAEIVHDAYSNLRCPVTVR